MISEEENKAIEFLKSDKEMLERNYSFGKEAKLRIANNIKKVLNLIEKKSKELAIKDKMIEEMTKYTLVFDKDGIMMSNNQRKEYFRKKAENEYGIRTAKYTMKYFREKVEK